MIKVSVIVPIYNVEKYVAKCLKSIQSQTLTDFECLVINDGTKDNSVKIAKEAVKGDDRFVFYDKENGGLSDARNYGLEKAKGEYICFIDSDDYIAEDLLELSYDAAKEHDSDIVCFDLYFDWGDRLDLSVGAFYDGVSSYSENKDIIYSNNSANNKIYRTSFLKERRFIKGMWYEDAAVVPVWIAEANNMVHVTKPLYYYVQREGSITHNSDERLFDIYKAVANVRKELGLSSRDVKRLYLDNCLVMTVLRIRDIDDKATRMTYYKKNVELLEENYPEWYEDALKEKDYSFKQRIIFTLLKLKMFKLVEAAYRR